MTRPAGSVRIFRLAGIDVYLHWTWAFIAYVMVRYRFDSYSAPAWALVEYVALFAIVLMHEYGHALACRSVGGRADTILLWPLGGVAFVQPPLRAGAYLWSIAAGPLVNVALLLPTWAAAHYARGAVGGDLYECILTLAYINTGLLIFNLLPIYPLDGGQLLRALIWLFAGPANSLLVAAMVGLAISAVALLITLRFGEMWLALISAFAAWQSWNGLMMARRWIQWQRWPRHATARCPRCGTPPPAGDFWRCDACGAGFDMIATGGQCPACGRIYETIPCPECRSESPTDAWLRQPATVRGS